MPSQFPSNNVEGDLKVTGKVTAGSGAVDIINATGKIPALSSTYLADLDGSNLTGITSVASVLSKTANYTVTTGDAGVDATILCNPAGGAFTITLFAASGNAGRKLTIVKTTSNALAVTVDGNASETINGLASVFLYAQWDYVTLVCDGTNWVVADHNITISWMAYTGATQTIATGTYTTVAFASETWDTASAYNTSTYKFTVPAGGAGYYQIYSNFRYSAMTSGSNIDNALYRTRSASDTAIEADWILEGYNQTAGSYDVGGGVYLLAAADDVFIKTYQASGSSRDIHDGQYTSLFRGHLLTPTWA